MLWEGFSGRPKTQALLLPSTRSAPRLDLLPGYRGDCLKLMAGRVTSLVPIFK